MKEFAIVSMTAGVLAGTGNDVITAVVSKTVFVDTDC